MNAITERKAPAISFRRDRATFSSYIPSESLVKRSVRNWLSPNSLSSFAASLLPPTCRK